MLKSTAYRKYWSEIKTQGVIEVKTQQMELKINYIIVENIFEIGNNSHTLKAHCFQEIH